MMLKFSFYKSMFYYAEDFMNIQKNRFFQITLISYLNFDLFILINNIWFNKINNMNL